MKTFEEKKIKLLKLNEKIPKVVFEYMKKEVFYNNIHRKILVFESQGIEYFQSSGTFWAVKNNKPIGFCLWHLLTDCGINGIASLNNIYVEQQFRGKKIGLTLLSSLYLFLLQEFSPFGLLSEQCGESEQGRKLLLKLKPMQLSQKNCMGEPLLLMTDSKFVLDNIKLKPTKNIDYFLNQISEDTKKLVALDE